MSKHVALWAGLFLINLLSGIVFRLLTPIICLFITRSRCADVVKRHGKKVVILSRDNILDAFSWFATPDNNVDEWWYGMYNTDHFAFARKWTQVDYDNSRFVRYYCRVMWLMRNSGYGFSLAFMSKPAELALETVYPASILWQRPSSFQYKGVKPLGLGFYNHFNIGWKKLKGVDRLTYAGRPIQIKRKA